MQFENLEQTQQAEQLEQLEQVEQADQAKQYQIAKDEYDKDFHHELDIAMNRFKEDRTQWKKLRNETLRLALQKDIRGVTVFELSLFQIRQAVQGDCTFFKSIFVDFLRISDD